jgi:hypothetical protein
MTICFVLNQSALALASKEILHWSIDYIIFE